MDESTALSFYESCVDLAPGEGVEPLNFDGDLYGGWDDVTRGVSMPLALEQDSGIPVDMFEDSDLHERRDGALEGLLLDSGTLGYCHQSTGMLSGLTCLPKASEADLTQCRFSQANKPPPIPDLVQLAATSLRVATEAPFEIGNIVLDFLVSRVKSLITKVNLKKFTVKAHVFMEGTSCVLKMRSYTLHTAATIPESYSVEFQRRGGDCMVFSRSYHMAAEYLSRRLPKVADVPRLPEARLQSPENSIADAVLLTAVLDLAVRDDASTESAESLLHLAHRKQEEAVGLCNLQSCVENFDCPTTCALSDLAEQLQDATSSANRGILPVVVDKLRCKDTRDRVWGALDRALARLPENISEEIAARLADVATEDVRGPLIFPHFQGAHKTFAHWHERDAPRGEATVAQCGGAEAATGSFFSACSLPPLLTPVQPASPANTCSPAAALPDAS